MWNEPYHTLNENGFQRRKYAPFFYLQLLIVLHNLYTFTVSVWGKARKCFQIHHFLHTRKTYFSIILIIYFWSYDINGFFQLVVDVQCSNFNRLLSSLPLSFLPHSASWPTVGSSTFLLIRFFQPRLSGSSHSSSTWSYQSPNLCTVPRLLCQFLGCLNSGISLTWVSKEI